HAQPRDALLPGRDVVLARELPGGLDRLGPARAEEDAVQITGRERRDLGRELDRARMRVRPVGVEGQLAHLLERRLTDLLAEAVADVDRKQTRQRVEVARAVDVLEVAAVAADDDRHLRVAVPAHAGEVHPEVLLRKLLQIDSGRGHLAPFERRIWIRTLPSMASTATAKIVVPITFTCGGAPTRAAPQTNRGNVTLL